MATILITGGAGFIGSHLARWSIMRGHSVLIIDNLSTGNPGNIPKEAVFLQGDISNQHFFESLKGYSINAVFHLAAQSSGEISHENPAVDLKVNTLGTINLLEFCKRNQVNQFLYASSMAIYGNQKKNPVRENFIPNPLSFYGMSKLFSEQYIKYYSKSGLNTTVFRMFSVYGPGQDLLNMKQGMVSIFLAYLLNDQPLTIKGRLDRFRDFIYIDDVCKAWMAALNNDTSFGKIYNIGTGEKTCVDELITTLCSEMNLDPSTYPIIVSDGTPDDQFGLYANIESIAYDLKWQPDHNLKSGIREFVRWAKKQSFLDGKIL